MLTKEQILKYLCSLPSEWADEIADLLLDFQGSIQTPDCQVVKDCQTITVLSDFIIDGTSVCIDYTDENEVTVRRCFDISELLNNTITDITPGCVTDVETWNTLTYEEKIQAFVDTLCNCCPPTTTTTTTSTSTSSTTTTTTAATTTTTTSSTTTTTTEATTTTTTTSSTTTTTTV